MDTRYLYIVSDDNEEIVFTTHLRDKLVQFLNDNNTDEQKSYDLIVLKEGLIHDWTTEEVHFGIQYKNGKFYALGDLNPETGDYEDEKEVRII